MRASQPWRTAWSRTLRAKGTSAEAKLWGELRNRQFAGLKFVRQAPIGRYFADFLCRDQKVIIEVDGATHGTEAELAADEARTRELGQLGFRIFRATNSDVFENIAGVLSSRLAFINKTNG